MLEMPKRGVTKWLAYVSRARDCPHIFSARRPLQYHNCSKTGQCWRSGAFHSCTKRRNITSWDECYGFKPITQRKRYCHELCKNDQPPLTHCFLTCNRPGHQSKNGLTSWCMTNCEKGMQFQTPKTKKKSSLETQTKAPQGCFGTCPENVSITSHRLFLSIHTSWQEQGYAKLKRMKLAI